MQNRRPLLQLNHVSASYESNRLFRKKSNQYVLRDINLELSAGEWLGLVGESGSGKTTLANVITGFMPISGGEIIFKNQSIAEFPVKQRSKEFRQAVQMVFQDPYGSFNPVLTIGRQLTEVLEIQKKYAGPMIREKVLRILQAIGLPEEYYDYYPGQLSGGQLQRAALGCAILMQPDLLLADEPVSSLDVSVQAQVLDLLQEIKENTNISCLFISHDLAVVYHICDTVAVLNQGQIVEQGPVEEIYLHPRTAYTKELISHI